MRAFNFTFQFEGTGQEARATELGGLDDIQYSISLVDEDLALRFGVTIVRKLKDEPTLQYAFPPAADAVEFMNALTNGLQKYLDSSK